MDRSPVNHRADTSRQTTLQAQIHTYGKFRRLSERDPAPDPSTVDLKVQSVWLMWTLCTVPGNGLLIRTQVHLKRWSWVHVYLGTVSIRCESYYTKTQKWTPPTSAYAKLERQHKQMRCSWWRKCTQVRRNITNMKVDWQGTGKGGGYHTQARYKEIVPNMKTPLESPINHTCPSAVLRVGKY